MICQNCNSEYNKTERLGKQGRVSICTECALEEGDVQRYTGNMIYSHKTAPSIQINKDPKVTQYILGQIEDSSEHKSGSLSKEADAFNYKGREE